MCLQDNLWDVFIQKFYLRCQFSFHHFSKHSTCFFIITPLRVSQKHSMNLGNDLGNGNACYTNIICKPSFQLFFAGHIIPSFWETDLSPLLHMVSVQYSKSHTGAGRCLYHVSKSRMSNKVCSSGKNFVRDSPNSPLPTSSFCSIYNSSQGNKVLQDLSFSRT